MEYTPVNYSQFQIINQHEANVREALWQTLKTNYAHLCWPPHRIDILLNIVKDSETPFSELCQIAAQLIANNRYSDVTAKDLLKAHQDPDRTLLQPVLRLIRNKVCRMMRITPSDQLSADLKEEIAVAYLINADKFCHSRSVGDGFQTQGYEAYQMTMGIGATKMIRSYLLNHSIASLDVLQDQFNFEPVANDRPVNRQEIESKLILAIRSALNNNPLAWELVRQMAYGNESMRDFASRTGRSFRKLSEGVSSKIKLSLQASLGISSKGKRKANLCRITTTIAQLLTQEEFEALAHSSILRADRLAPLLPIDKESNFSTPFCTGNKNPPHFAE